MGQMSKRNKPKYIKYDINYFSILHLARKEYEGLVNMQFQAVGDVSRYTVETQERLLKGLIKVEQLIEFLECYNCGSIGGFDECNGVIQREEVRYSGSLSNRLFWLEEMRGE